MIRPLSEDLVKPKPNATTIRNRKYQAYVEDVTESVADNIVENTNENESILEAVARNPIDDSPGLNDNPRQTGDNTLGARTKLSLLKLAKPRLVLSNKTAGSKKISKTLGSIRSKKFDRELSSSLDSSSEQDDDPCSLYQDSGPNTPSSAHNALLSEQIPIPLERSPVHYVSSISPMRVRNPSIRTLPEAESDPNTTFDATPRRNVEAYGKLTSLVPRRTTR